MTWLFFNQCITAVINFNLFIYKQQHRLTKAQSKTNKRKKNKTKLGHN